MAARGPRSAAGGARYWIDGYNVLLRLKLGEDRPFSERRAELIARVAATGIAAWIAFDSRESVHGVALALPRRVQVTFASPGTTADALLIDKVRHARDLHGVIVVTDDRELGERVGFLGSRTMRVAEFGRMLKPASPQTPARERPLSRADVADWVRWLSDPKNDDRRRP